MRRSTTHQTDARSNRGKHCSMQYRQHATELSHTHITYTLHKRHSTVEERMRLMKRKGVLTMEHETSHHTKKSCLENLDMHRISLNEGNMEEEVGGRVTGKKETCL
jgi:hypothetical protein